MKKSDTIDLSDERKARAKNRMADSMHLNTVRFAAAVAVVYYSLLALMHPFFLTGATKFLMMGIAASTAILCLILYVLIRKGRIRASHSHQAFVFISALLMLNTYTHIFLTGEQIQLSIAVFLPALFGIICIKRIYFIGLTIASTALYFSAVVLVPGPYAAHFIILYLIGLSLGLVSYGPRVRMLFDQLGNLLVNRRNAILLNQQRQKIEALYKESQAANKAKSEFLSSVSHELRTPLNAILGFGEFLDDPDIKLSKQQREGIKHIQGSGQHLLNLINEILDLSRIESGHATLSIEPLDVKSFVGPGIVIAKSLGDSHGIRVENRAELEKLPMIAGDLTRCKQVIINLLSNAVKYNQPGGSVYLDARTNENKQVRFSITDTGPGIPEAMQAKLFEPFNRLGMEGSKTEGTGIGLTITKELVERMGGQIGFESTINVGSVFWFELPISESQKAFVQSNPDSAPTWNDDLDDLPTPDASSPRRVFYVEDNVANIDLVKMIATKYPSVNLSIAENAEDGLERIFTNPPDLILMDINLPGMDGVEATKILKNDPRTNRIPVVAVTASAMEHDVERGMQAGVDAYVTKPFRVRDVAAILAGNLSEFGTVGASKSVETDDTILDSNAIAAIMSAREVLPESYNEILQNMYEAIPDLLAEIKTTLSSQDCAATERAAHRLKSNSATLGARKLSELAQKVESQAAESNLSDARHDLSAMENELARVAPSIEGLLKT